MRVVLATKNRGKQKEFLTLAKNTKLKFIVPPKNIAFPKETGDTFKANALLKAKRVFSLTGMSTLADDSGLEVDFLEGKPGVHSSRFSKEGSDLSNIEKLLKEMEGLDENKRTARFKCCLVFIKNKKTKPLVTVGHLEGIISEKKKGGLGFGYDPIFVIKESGLHLAELEDHQKNSISHRAVAFKLLLKKLA